MSAHPGLAVDTTPPGRRFPVVSVAPDPKLSNLRPGWLADDHQWRDQLDAMDSDDVRWLERHWETAGGAKAGLDLSWVRTENVGDGLLWPILLGSIVIVGTLVVALGGLFMGGGS